MPIGLSKLPLAAGSEHGSLKSYTDGHGAEFRYGYGLHEVARFVSVEDDFDEDDLTRELALYTCAIRDPVSGKASSCVRCPCGDDPLIGCDPVSAAQCAVDPDLTQQSGTIAFEPGRGYRLKVRTKGFTIGDDRSVNPNARCCSDPNRGNFNNQQKASVEVVTGGTIYPVEVPFNGPNAQRVDLDLFDLIPNLADQTTAIDITFRLTPSTGPRPSRSSATSCHPTPTAGSSVSA